MAMISMMAESEWSTRRGIILEKANPMSGVFRNIDPPGPTPSPPGECVHPAFGAVGRHTRQVEREWGVNSSEDARHCSVFYICKYFVGSLHARFTPNIVYSSFISAKSNILF